MNFIGQNTEMVLDVISGMQARMARAGLKLTVREIAEATGLDKNTVSSFENDHGAHTNTAQKLKSYFESLGVAFQSEASVTIHR